MRYDTVRRFLQELPGEVEVRMTVKDKPDSPNSITTAANLLQTSFSESIISANNLRLFGCEDFIIIDRTTLQPRHGGPVERRYVEFQAWPTSRS